MKINKIILFSLLILAIFTLGAVSAADSNDTALSDGILEDASVVNLDESYDDEYYNVYIDSYYINDTSSEYPNEISVDIWDSEISGNISISVDDVEYYHAQSTERMSHFLNIDKLNLSYGKHIANIVFTGNDKFKDFNISQSFDYNYYHVGFQYDNEEITYEQFNVVLPDDATGIVKFTINGKTLSEKIDGGYASLDLDEDDYGKYTVKTQYLNGNYPGFTKTVKFIKVYEYSFFAYDEDIYCGDSAEIYIDFPSYISDNAYILVNGKKQSVKLSESGDAEVILNDLPLGENKITLKHDGDNEYPPISRDLTVNVKPYVKVPYNTSFKNSENVVVKLPKNATGNAVVKIDGVEFKKEALKNGCANVSLDGLELGKHNIDVSFDGNYKYLGSINHSLDVTPYVKVNQLIWVNSTETFEFEAPEGNTGKLNVLLFDDVLINETSFTNFISKQLPKLRFGHYDLSVSYMEENYTYNHTFDIFVKWQNPVWQMNVTYFKEYLNGYVYDDDWDAFVENLPKDADGYIELYVGGKYYSKVSDDRINFPLSKLSVGKHSFELKFTGDSYYSDSSFKGTIELVDVKIFVPDPITLKEIDDYFYLELSKNVKGTVTLKIDGKQIDKVKLSGGYGDDFYSYSFGDLPFGKHTYDISFKASNSQSVRKTGSFVYDYYFEIDNYDNLYYGSEASLIWIRAPDDATGTLKISIDNETYAEKIADQVSIDVSKYMGKHKLKVSYDGDKKYHKTSAEIEFNVMGEIDTVYGLMYNDTHDNLSIRLPGDAGGYLFVKIDGREYANVSLINGTAEVTFDKLGVGRYGLTAEYIGGKYNVDPCDNDIVIDPKIVYDQYNDYDNDFTVSIELPENETGNFSIKINGKRYVEKVAGGKASITLKNLAIGDYDETEIKYGGDEYNFKDYIRFYITPKITVPANMTYGESKTIQITAPKDFKSTIHIYDDEGYSKYYSFKNGKATAKVPIMPAGNQYFTIAFLSDDIDIHKFIYIDVFNATSPTILADDASLYYRGGKTYNVQILGCDGYPVGAGEIVGLKIKNKVMNVKTDFNGFAKFKIDNLPKTYSVAVNYKNVSVTKKVTVKPILTLKTVKVKKSAKKLVLTAKLAKKLKNKKITFKFNGKKYTAKTNKKGIAKVTIKKSYLKKLKVGKKVKYSATYVKQTVKKSCKVKK